MTLIFIGYGLLVNVMTSYRDIVLIIPLMLTGIAIDLFQSRAKAGERLTLGGIRAVGPLAAGVLWISYYAVLAADKGLGLDADDVGGRDHGRPVHRLRRRLPGRTAVLRPAARRRLRLEVLVEEGDDLVGAF